MQQRAELKGDLGRIAKEEETQAEEMLHRGQEVGLRIRELLVHLMSDDRAEHNEDLNLVPDYNAVLTVLD